MDKKTLARSIRETIAMIGVDETEKLLNKTIKECMSYKRTVDDAKKIGGFPKYKKDVK